MAEWWKAFAIGTKLTDPLGQKVVITEKGPTVVGSDQYAAMRTAPQPNSADVARVKGMQDGADSSAALARISEEMMQHNAHVPSGPLLGRVNLPFTDQNINPALAIAKAVNPDAASMDSLNVQAAKDMRAPGQRLTQMEWAKNLTAVPGPGQTYDANRSMTADNERNRILQGAQSSFYARWLQKTGSTAGADAAWQAFRQQHFSPQGEWLGSNPSVGAATLKATSGATQAARPVNDPLGLLN